MKLKKPGRPRVSKARLKAYNRLRSGKPPRKESNNGNDEAFHAKRTVYGRPIPGFACPTVTIAERTKNV